jgi:putative membrane protein
MFTNRRDDGFRLRHTSLQDRPMNNPCLVAAATVLLLSACEKPAGPANTPATATTDVAASGTLVASALPALPSVADPVFGPIFVDTAGTANLFEIAEGKLALTRSGNAEVKAFASMMIDAHTKSTAALRAAVEASGQTIDLPSALSDALQTKLGTLTETDAAGFDKAYMADQVAAHEGALSGLQIYARRGDMPALKKFATDTVPAVEDHLTRAKALQASLK